MAEQITSAAELDALPDDSIARFPIRISGGPREVAAIKRGGKWYLTGVFTADGHGYKASELLEDATGPLTVLYRPDEPQRVQPSREDVARALFAHRHPNEFWGSGGSEGRREWYAAEADAVLALLPGRSEAEVKADAWDEGFATGKSRAMRHMSDEPGLPLDVPNPYRADRLEAEVRHG